MNLEEFIESQNNRYPATHGKKRKVLFGKMYSGICSSKFCNKEFYTVDSKKRYCRFSHGKSSKRKIFNCRGCNKVIQVIPCFFYLKTHFCSRDCRKLITGNKHPRWKPSSLNGEGYATFRINGKTRRAHRVIMEQHIGRKLLPTEIIHHIDGNKVNNSIGNLELTTFAEHTKNHWIARRKH